MESRRRSPAGVISTVCGSIPSMRRRRGHGRGAGSALLGAGVARLRRLLVLPNGRLHTPMSAPLLGAACNCRHRGLAIRGPARLCVSPGLARPAAWLGGVGCPQPSPPFLCCFLLLLPHPPPASFIAAAAFWWAWADARTLLSPLSGVAPSDCRVRGCAHLAARTILAARTAATVPGSRLLHRPRRIYVVPPFTGDWGGGVACWRPQPCLALAVALAAGAAAARGLGEKEETKRVARVGMVGIGELHVTDYTTSIIPILIKHYFSIINLPLYP